MQAEHTGLSKQGIRSVTQQGQDGFNTAEDKVFHAQLHTHPFNGPFSRTTQVSRYQKVKPILILLNRETVSGSGVIWAICKSALRSRQTTTPASHHSVAFLAKTYPFYH